MFPAFMEMKVDEMHSHGKQGELDIIASHLERFHVAVGLVEIARLLH